MAEICCNVGGGVSEPSDVAGRRRRRMEILRLAVEPMPEEPRRKKLHSSGDGDGDGVSDLRSNLKNLILNPSESESESAPRYGMTSICGRRKEMEDAVSIRPDFLPPSRYHFFGVYDGHGCSHVAVSCRDRMHEILRDEMGKLGSDWGEVMWRSFARMDEEAAERRRPPSCRCELQKLSCNHVGSTAVVAVVGDGEIVVANCGDSRAVLCRKGVAVPLSCDHKPDRTDELQRIEAAGGRVIYWDGARVLGVLAMSRAIGDGYLKPFVVSEPEVTVRKRTEEDECLVLASDGLWDVMTNETACYVARMCLRINNKSEDMAPTVEGLHSGSDKACSDAATLLTKLALARGSSDNVSVVVIDLRNNL